MRCDCPPRRNRRVTIERPGGTPDVAGHVDLTQDSNWEQVGNRWAAFKTRGGREGALFDQTQADVSHVIEMRYDSLTQTIQPTWRLRYDGRLFNIVSAFDVDELHQRVRVQAIEAK